MWLEKKQLQIQGSWWRFTIWLMAANRCQTDAPSCLERVRYNRVQNGRHGGVGLHAVRTNYLP